MSRKCLHDEEHHDAAAARDQYQRLFENNRRWAAEKTRENPSYFTNLAKGQQPEYMLIGCSDSRAPPDQLTQTQPGDIFIHRNVANLVVHTDMNIMAVLQYAVEVLKVRHVIVMGHYECGGVKASMGRDTHGLIDKWLGNIKDVYRLHKAELDALPEGTPRLNRLIELNVIEQVMNLRKTSIIQRAWSLGQDVAVHGWVYDIHTGLARDLEVHKLPLWKEIENIYSFEFKDVAEMLSKTPAIPLDDEMKRSLSHAKLLPHGDSSEQVRAASAPSETSVAPATNA